ncbi:MAG: HD domain-containing protein [Bacillota bacterium]
MTGDVIAAMIEYYKGDVARINHFLKVFAFAKSIGEREGLDSALQEILEVAAVTHDIGIKPSEQKYNSAAGKYQELEGPPVAREMLTGLGYAPEIVKRVCYLIGRHHTYHGIDGLDYQILVEADFLVNLHEHQSGLDEVCSVREKIFRTKTGLEFLDRVFLCPSSGV